MDKMKKNLSLSKRAVRFVPCLAVSVISQVETYTYDTGGHFASVAYDSGEAQPQRTAIAEQEYTVLYMDSACQSEIAK
ncbi:MAG: hypothetical protein AMJ75_00060 [Phycisphaerae bacterium SM1_79]|nr:MAG: hypothetical protein AMJ75_00060 [Phycisphaerae bacterium SM1_79]